MRRSWLAFASLAIGFVVLSAPSAALAVAPAVTPAVIRAEGFETAPASDWLIEMVYDPIVTPTAYWGRVTQRAASGSYGLWCAGAPSGWGTGVYPDFTGGLATLALPQLTDYYSATLSYKYTMPSLGSDDGNAFNVLWDTTPHALWDYHFGRPLTAVNGWNTDTWDMSAPANKVNVSRRPARVRFNFLDSYGNFYETPTTGEGATIDDVLVSGYRYGPVRSLAATLVAGDTHVTWSVPWRSTDATSAEERAITYRVWRSPDVMPYAWTELTASATGGTSLTDTGTPSGAFRYAVQAVEPGGPGYGELGVSAAVVKDVVITVPAAPSGLTATAAAGPSVRLTWTDASDNESGFVVERSLTSAAGPWSTLTTMPAGSTVATDTGVSYAVPYWYRVRAYNSAGSAASSAAAITLVAPPHVATVNRVGGLDRYEVAVNLAREAFPNWLGVNTVIIACGSDAKAADPLGAAGLSGAANAPVLLVRTDSKTQVPTPTRNALTAIAAANGAKPAIIVVGGPLSVTPAQWSTLAGYGSSIRRISGADRYAVAANVAYEIRSRNGGTVPFVLIAAGNTPARFFEPLALGPIAAKMKAPVLLTKASVVPPATLAAVRALAPDPANRYLGSDVAVVNEAARSALGATRIPGLSLDRTVLASSVARYAIGKGWLSAGTVGVTNALADSLGGGAAMGRLGGPILYTGPGGAGSPSTTLFLTDYKGSVDVVDVIGGPASVPESTLTTLKSIWP